MQSVLWLIHVFADLNSYPTSLASLNGKDWYDNKTEANISNPEHFIWLTERKLYVLPGSLVMSPTLQRSRKYRHRYIACRSVPISHIHAYLMCISVLSGQPNVNGTFANCIGWDCMELRQASALHVTLSTFCNSNIKGLCTCIFETTSHALDQVTESQV